MLCMKYNFLTQYSIEMFFHKFHKAFLWVILFFWSLWKETKTRAPGKYFCLMKKEKIFSSSFPFNFIIALKKMDFFGLLTFLPSTLCWVGLTYESANILLSGMRGVPIISPRDLKSSEPSPGRRQISRLPPLSPTPSSECLCFSFSSVL